MHVAIAILPELADPSVAGRQQVIACVSKQVRELAKGGDVAEIRPTDTTPPQDVPPRARERIRRRR
jgi:hypothetical protein